jgi:hypothetical protein
MEELRAHCSKTTDGRNIGWNESVGQIVYAVSYATS